MKLFSYKCVDCGYLFDLTVNDPPVVCVRCDGWAKRDYSTVQLSRPTFVPHFNHTVGEHVSSSRDFDNALKRKSEEQSERTGMDHSYARLDPGDMPQPTGESEIYETRGKFLRDNA